MTVRSDGVSHHTPYPMADDNDDIEMILVSLACSFGEQNLETLAQGPKDDERKSLLSAKLSSGFVASDNPSSFLTFSR
jgi:hypothetical protein